MVEEKIRRRTVICLDMRKRCQIHISLSINKVVSEHSHISFYGCFHAAAGKLCPKIVWPTNLSIFASWSRTEKLQCRKLCAEPYYLQYPSWGCRALSPKQRIRDYIPGSVSGLKYSPSHRLASAYRFNER